MKATAVLPAPAQRLTPCQALYAQASGAFSAKYDRLLWLTPLGLALLFLAVRLCLPVSLNHDESEQLFYAQELRWGYSQQPPLFTWLTWASLKTFGVNAFALTFVRVTIYATLFWLTALGIRELGSSARVAMAGAMTLLFIPLFGWKLPFSYMHTLLATALVAATLWIALRLLKSPSLANYLALGLATALGVLAKYNFVWFAGALVVAGLTLPATRRLILCWRMSAAALGAGLLLTPHLAWLADHAPVLYGSLLDRLDLEQPGWRLESTLIALATWVRQAFLCVLPMAAAFWLLPPARSCRPSVRSPQAPVAQAPVALALVERTASLTLLLTLAVVLAGVGSFRMHWLAPAAVFGPVIVCGRLARRGREVRCRRLAAAIALVVFGIIVYRLGTAWVDKSRHRDRFFDEAARVVVERGWSERHFLTNHLVVAANLRLRCPGISVACTYCPAFRPAPAATAPGLAVWSVVEDRDAWIERDPSSIVVKAAPAEHDPQYRRLVFGLEETACRTIAAGAGVPGRWIVVLPAESY